MDYNACSTRLIIFFLVQNGLQLSKSWAQLFFSVCVRERERERQKRKRWGEKDLKKKSDVKFCAMKLRPKRKEEKKANRIW